MHHHCDFARNMVGRVIMANAATKRNLPNMWESTLSWLLATWRLRQMLFGVPVHRLFPVTISREIHRLGRVPWALYFSMPAGNARLSTVD